MTELSDEILARWSERFEAARDPVRARAMGAYMKDHFAFLGVPTPERVALSSDAIRGLTRLDADDLTDLVTAAWRRDEREYQYAALWMVRREQRLLTSAFLPTAQRCITERSWWDTVDVLAQHVVGPIVRADRPLQALMADWLASDDIWLARAAILHMERWGDDTDADLLFSFCAQRAGDTEFFIRKAIGWALRSYSYVDPVAVERFVHEHDAELSGLSKREAMKAIERRRRSG